jgi:hypothetical protein
MSYLFSDMSHKPLDVPHKSPAASKPLSGIPESLPEEEKGKKNRPMKTGKITLL